MQVIKNEKKKVPFNGTFSLSLSSEPSLTSILSSIINTCVNPTFSESLLWKWFITSPESECSKANKSLFHSLFFFLILLQIFGTHLFGEFELNSVLLSQRYSTDCTGYYTSAGSLSFSWASILQIIRSGYKSERIITMILPFCSHRAKVECYAH